MYTFTTIFNTVWGILTIIAQILVVLLITAHISPRLRAHPFFIFFKERGLQITFIVSLFSVIGSLGYSDVIGYTPCTFCWFQRIFMYPQVILMGIALVRKEYTMKLYGLVLSSIGAVIALFHYSGQLSLVPLPCTAVGVSVSCSARFVMQFGYITIPMMALSAFLLIVAVLSLSFRK